MRINWEYAGEVIGKQLRFAGAAYAFSAWQDSWQAGLFIYCVFITLDGFYD